MARKPSKESVKTPKSSGLVEERVAIDANRFVDFPVFSKAAHNHRGRRVTRVQRVTVGESEWTANVMAQNADWYDAVDLKPIARYDLECNLRIRDMDGNVGPTSGSLFARIDAVAYHEDGSVSLIESKIDGTPTELMRGVGQLLYYKTLFNKVQKTHVDNLVLACPSVPPFVVDTILDLNLPVRILKVTNNAFAGFCPANRHVPGLIESFGGIVING